MSERARVLQVAFESADAFAAEYARNLCNGGVFVATRELAEPREAVRVDIVLSFCGQSAQFPGEVVHIVPASVESTGAAAGVAIQLAGAPRDIRERMAPLLAACGLDGDRVPDEGRRRAGRTNARVPARIDGTAEPVQGRTRNLSRSGVLVQVPGGAGARVGSRVRVTLENPTSGESMEVEGRVVREVESGGDVAALGISFDPPEERRDAVEQFVEGVQSAEHARSLGGIQGSVEELGAQALLQMFGATAPAGTLVLRRGAEEGVIGFEGGLLRYVELGTGTGMKALVRLLAWEEGSFEFHARLEPREIKEAPLPLDAALFDAVRQIDELGRVDEDRFPPDARVRVCKGAAAEEERSKVESAVLDLARAGFTVRRIVDVIPEPDPDIFRAFDALADAGLISFES